MAFPLTYMLTTKGRLSDYAIDIKKYGFRHLESDEDIILNNLIAYNEKIVYNEGTASNEGIASEIVAGDICKLFWDNGRKARLYRERSIPGGFKYFGVFKPNTNFLKADSRMVNGCTYYLEGEWPKWLEMPVTHFIGWETDLSNVLRPMIDENPNATPMINLNDMLDVIHTDVKSSHGVGGLRRRG
jgi:hypothetical protein